MESKRINSFRDLVAWQSSHELTVEIFKRFKDSRNGNLRNQIERSSLSVSSNIAEGFGRSSPKDKEHFFVMARGSAYEVQSQLMVARDIGEIPEDIFLKLFDLSEQSIKILHGLIRSTKGL